MLQKNPANQGRKFQLCVLLHSRNQVGIMTSTWFFKTQRHTDTVHWISLTHLSRLVWKLVVRVATGKTIEFLFFLSFFSLLTCPFDYPSVLYYSKFSWIVKFLLCEKYHIRKAYTHSVLKAMVQLVFSYYVLLINSCLYNRMSVYSLFQYYPTFANLGLCPISLKRAVLLETACQWTSCFQWYRAQSFHPKFAEVG